MEQIVSSKIIKNNTCFRPVGLDSAEEIERWKISII
jgi:hypothetical protein